MRFHFLFYAICYVVFFDVMPASSNGNCGVCKAVLEKTISGLSETEMKSTTKIEGRLMTFCKETKNKKEARFCWYVGAAKDSATRVINDITKPLSTSLPVERVCDKLGQKDGEICGLEYDKEIDWTAVDKLKVRELKKILDEWGEQCQGCTEKSEFVKKIKDLIPKYVKAEL